MTPPAIPKITIDTNCVVGLFDLSSATAASVEEPREIMRYASSGTVNVAIMTRVEIDFGRDKNEERRNEMQQYMSTIPAIGTVERWDQSTWGGPNVLVDPRGGALIDEVQRIMLPELTPTRGGFDNQIADVDHLAGHRPGRRERGSYAPSMSPSQRSN